ncbi:MAG TPA: hypothetical protein VFP71_05150 [Candidatus Angelobacter sp.]|nr:hypothetical protein [Candidatus Angelobacter sp.]
MSSMIFTGSCPAEQSPDFTGNWAVRFGKRIFLTLTITPATGSTGQFTGSLVLPQQFSFLEGGTSFSNIKGPVVRHLIVRSVVKADCLLLTTQNTVNKEDKNNFQFCITGQGHGTLKFVVTDSLPLPLINPPFPLTKASSALTVSTDWDSAQMYYLDDSDVSSTEMQQIYEADQKDRPLGKENVDWEQVNKSDAARRQATAKLLADGKLHTGEDFERAAMVFQHGNTPDDFLLAHTFAMVAVARGQRSALWIASASLDRYLRSIHQPQIYGTQYATRANNFTQEPYNRTLVPDFLRQFLNVPSQAAQEEQRKLFVAQPSQP